jgi:hypothetical protein
MVGFGGFGGGADGFGGALFGSAMPTSTTTSTAQFYA